MLDTLRTSAVLGSVVALAGLSSVSVAAGSVLVVDDDAGPGVDFTTLDAAVAAASNGDTVLVRDGQYGAMTISGKSLNVVADTDASVQLGPIVVEDLLADQFVILNGLEIVRAEELYRLLQISGNAGSVWVENSLIQPQILTIFPIVGFPDTTSAVIVENSSEVFFSQCDISGGNSVVGTFNHIDASDAMRVEASSVAIFDSTLVGGAGAAGFTTLIDFLVPGSDGANGLRMLNLASVYASGSTFIGSPGGNGALQGLCTDAGNGGNGVLTLGAPLGFGSSLIDIQNTFQGGPGGLALDPACADGLDGKAVRLFPGDVIAVPSGIAPKSLSAESPVRGGDSTQLTFTGTPGDFAIALVGVNPLYGSALQGLLLVDSFTVLSAGVVPASGALPVTVNANSPATLQALTLLIQPVFVTAPSQPLGEGLVTLGSAASLTILDASL